MHGNISNCQEGSQDKLQETQGWYHKMIYFSFT